MIVEYLRDLDYVPAGTVAWEPDGVARVLIDAGFARETDKRPPRTIRGPVGRTREPRARTAT